jgi:CheY-like chemotaxis protein
MAMNTFERFVLIDDNEADNVFHEIMIQRAGFTGEVLVFESGLDALDWFAHKHDSVPTCVFLDINMPLMDGFEVAEKATPLLQGKPTTVLVMLTSSGSPADKARALAMPIIKDYVTKPLTVDQIKSLMATPAA